MAIHPTRVHKAGLTRNEKFASLIADLLGSPWTIYIFSVIALVSLPAVLTTGDLVLIVGWVAQTFIQLVALAVLQAKAVLDGSHSEEIANAIYDNAVKAEKVAEEILDRLALLEKKQS